MSPVVVLVGPPGAGKSTVARLLAERLGVVARDTDDDVEERVGGTVSEVFVEQGEQRFRELERDAVAAALADHHGVLALGGGAVLDPGTRVALRDEHVVFLDVGLADAAQRVGLSTARPLLLGNVRGQLKALLDARRPVYTEVATATVVTDDVAPDEVADRVLATLPVPS